MVCESFGLWNEKKAQQESENYPKTLNGVLDYIFMRVEAWQRWMKIKHDRHMLHSNCEGRLKLSMRKSDRVHGTKWSIHESAWKMNKFQSRRGYVAKLVQEQEQEWKRDRQTEGKGEDPCRCTNVHSGILPWALWIQYCSEQYVVIRCNSQHFYRKKQWYQAYSLITYTKSDP